MSLTHGSLLKVGIAHHGASAHHHPEQRPEVPFPRAVRVLGMADDVVLVKGVGRSLAIVGKASAATAVVEAGSRGQSVVVHLVTHRTVDVKFSGHRLLNAEGGSFGILLPEFLTGIHLESLVHQFRAQPASQTAVLGTAILVDHSHDVAFARLTESHETLDQLLCLLAIIDVTHEVTHVVHDQDIGSVGIHAFGDEVIALTDIDGTHIEHEEAVFRKLTVDELHHALSEDVLRALRILFGIHPHHLQRLLPDPFDADQPTLLPVSGATGHEDRDEHGLTRLGLTRDDCQVFSRQTGFAVDVEKEILILNVAGRYDTQFVEFQEQGCNQRGLSCLGEFL